MKIIFFFSHCFVVGNDLGNVFLYFYIAVTDSGNFLEISALAEYKHKFFVL